MVKLFSYAIHHRFRDATPPLPRKRISEAYRPALDAYASSKFEDNSAWTLRLSGAGGGVWKINSLDAGEIDFSSAWIHTTTEQWKLILKQEVSVDEWLAGSRVLLNGNKEVRALLRREIERLVQECRTFDSKPNGKDDSELPSVVPMRRKKGGRRHA